MIIRSIRHRRYQRRRLQRNLDGYIADYRTACTAAGIDPLIGPEDIAESLRCIHEYQQRRGAWWWWIDWLDNSIAHSVTERLAFVRLWIQALYATESVEAAALVEMPSINHGKPLREILAARGAHLERVEITEGVWVSMVIEPEKQLAAGAAD